MKQHLLQFIKNEDGFIGALIGGAVSLLGAKKARKDEVSDRQTHFREHRASAEAAGFNPLTALEATGGQFGSGQRTPPLATAQFIADAVQGYQDEVSGKTALERDKLELQNDLMRIQIDKFRSGVAEYQSGRPAGLSVRGNASAKVGNEREWGGYYTKRPRAYDKAGNLTTPALTFGGSIWDKSPDNSDQQIVEEAYGEIVGNIAGVGAFLSDSNNVGNRIRRSQARQRRADQKEKLANEDALFDMPLSVPRMSRMAVDPRFGTSPIRSISPTYQERVWWDMKRYGM